MIFLLLMQKRCGVTDCDLSTADAEVLGHDSWGVADCDLPAADAEVLGRDRP